MAALNRSVEDLTADPSIIEGLLNMLNENNSIVKAFRMERNRFFESNYNSIQLILIGQRNNDGKNSDRPRALEIVALIVGDIGESDAQRNIIVEDHREGVKRISELHFSFMAIQYHLLFSYG